MSKGSNTTRNSGANARAATVSNSIRQLRPMNLFAGNYYNPLPVIGNSTAEQEIKDFYNGEGKYKGFQVPQEEASSVLNVPISKLSTAQPQIVARKLEELQNSGFQANQQANDGSYPMVIKNGDKYLLVDGNHRAALAYINGENNLKARVFDLKKIDKKI